VLCDPLYSLDLRQYLSQFLLEFSRQPYYPHFSQHLNLLEKKQLSSMGIQVA